MKISRRDFRNEYLYGMTMVHVRGMLKKGLITEEEYREASKEMKEKYRPISDGLVSESACYVPRKER